MTSKPDYQRSSRGAMQVLGCLNAGVVLLSSDFRVMGMNEIAMRLLGPAMQELGKPVFQYHPPRSQPKIKGLLSESLARPDIPTTMIIDVLKKALMINVSKVTMKKPLNPMFAMTFLDISDQVGAEANPQTGIVELKKFPVCSKNALQFLDMQSIHFIQSDGNYCKVFTEAGFHYIKFTLKNILKRYAGLKFCRVHKSFIVNVDHIDRIERDSRGNNKIVFDRKTVPMVPVARRKMHELKNMLGIPRTSRA